MNEEIATRTEQKMIERERTVIEAMQNPYETIVHSTKQELLDKTQVIQEAVNQRYQEEFNRYKAWFLKRRQKVLDEVTAHRRPGILDRISTCESREAAHLMWHEFLDSANSVSQKTINKANRLLATLDFPLP